MPRQVARNSVVAKLFRKIERKLVSEKMISNKDSGIKMQKDFSRHTF